jgi:hypothetical protein
MLPSTSKVPATAHLRRIGSSNPSIAPLLSGDYSRRPPD